uniref:Putative secreted protein n=1 Tax=Ixodes ricinus TaxID=34613 RepID=A0A6B0UHE3_IXORI
MFAFLSSIKIIIFYFNNILFSFSYYKTKIGGKECKKQLLQLDEVLVPTHTLADKQRKIKIHKTQKIKYTPAHHSNHYTCLYRKITKRHMPLR